jgi:hypothetical protein
MSTDYYVICDEDKTYWFLGARFAGGPVFGYGSNDPGGRHNIMTLIVDNCHKGLRIATDDDALNEHSGYTELDTYHHD